MRVLLLGGSGFLGLSIAQCLRGRNVEVTVADRADRLARNTDSLASYRTVAIETRDAAQFDFSGVDTLIYLASATLPSTSMRSLSHDSEANIAPALRVFERAVERGVGRIVFSSSGGTVYGQARSLPITEEHPTVPISAYGVSKLAIERYLSLLGHVSNVEAISLRVANPFGPYQFRGVGVGAVARFLQCVHADETIEIWGDGSVVRDYIYVDDVADAFATACLMPGLASGEYNIGSGEGISLNDLVERIAEVCHREVKVDHKPARIFDVPRVVLDWHKFARTSGWRPSTPFATGLQRMWQYLRQ